MLSMIVVHLIVREIVAPQAGKLHRCPCLAAHLLAQILPLDVASYCASSLHVRLRCGGAASEPFLIFGSCTHYDKLTHCDVLPGTRTRATMGRKPFRLAPRRQQKSAAGLVMSSKASFPVTSRILYNACSLCTHTLVREALCLAAPSETDPAHSYCQLAQRAHVCPA